MPNKHPAYCPTCVDRNLTETEMPCTGCGFPPFWHHNYPNLYRADADHDLKPSGQVVDLQAVKPAEPEPEPEPPIELGHLSASAIASEDDIISISELEPVEEGVITIPEEATATVDTELEPEPVPEVHIDDDDYYYCKKCKSRHNYDSGIGKRHLKHRE